MVNVLVYLIIDGFKAHQQVMSPSAMMRVFFRHEVTMCPFTTKMTN